MTVHHVRVSAVSMPSYCRSRFQLQRQKINRDQVWTSAVLPVTPCRAGGEGACSSRGEEGRGDSVVVGSEGRLRCGKSMKG